MKTEARLALDRASVRTYDGDGRLHISAAHISKSNVCPYLGSEIPNAEALGLRSDQTYMLLRHPDELAKAAPTLNNIQLLIKHDPVSPSDPKKDLTVGSTGTDAAWNPPYLDNSLVVWDADAIRGIESDTQKELSAGYYYTADMTPGVYEGTAYDGVMRDIRFNHVALVVEGRAGDDVVVGDSMENLNMNKRMSLKAALAQGAIAVVLKPRLAQDAKLDLAPVMAGVTHANWAKSKERVMDTLRKLPATLFKDKAAMDAAMKEAVDTMNALDDADPDSNLEGVEFKGGAAKQANDSPREALEALLKGKISDEDLERVIQLAEGSEAADEEDLDTDIKLDKEMIPLLRQLIAKLGGNAGTGAQDAEEGSGEEDEGSDAAIGENVPAAVAAKNKAAMDAAIKRAEDRAVARMQAMDEAKRLVKPIIGKVMAQDSAESVYRLALDEKGVDVKGVHPSAYKAMVQLLLAQPQGGDKHSPKPAMDAAAHADFSNRFPTAGKIKQL